MLAKVMLLFLFIHHHKPKKAGNVFVIQRVFSHKKGILFEYIHSAQHNSYEGKSDASEAEREKNKMEVAHSKLREGKENGGFFSNKQLP